jgi:excisionase family DNA binding protein
MSPIENAPQYATVDEAASRLRVKSQTVRNWCKAGTLPYVKVGQRYLIPQSALSLQPVVGDSAKH